LIKRNITVPSRGNNNPIKRRPRNNQAKRDGLAKLREYELEEALIDFKKAQELDPQDPEIYFHMACAYSILEKTKEGFEAIKKAKELGFKDDDTILKHDMLAFLRIQDAFEGFLNSGFKEYDKKLMDQGEDDVVE